LQGATAPAPTSPSAPLRTSFANGRYQVKSFLGEGGKKKVYLAHDTLLDRDVAFALIKSEGLDEASRTRIQREAQAMGRLGSHPHIVTVFDLGQEGDRGGFETRPYLVSELMTGGDVAAAIEAAPDHRLPLDQAVHIAQQVCRGLEFAHSRGIVHRDLKPGNVWLTADGTAKVGDFGLAVALDRSRLTAEGMMVGTVAYMPPEQALGSEVTPKADLYSLGAMLYEMVTGRPPFLGDDPVAIIGQHINTPPVAPTWHNGQCPRPLEALILRLLAKDPAERPGSATDVLAALEAMDTTDVGASRLVGTAPSDQAHALDSLAGGVFVGRQREMGELKAALEDALSGRGRLLTLVGEPGIGKTRTAQELATYAGLRQCQVLWGRCYEEQGAPPYWPWVQAIRSYVRDREEQQLRSEMGAGAADIAEVVSDVRERLPDLKSAPQLEPEQARFRLFDSIAAFLKSAGRRQPLVLVLEDLHWADRPSLLLLEFVARELAGSRLLVMGTYRDVDVSRRHPLSQTLGELTRERLFQRILLRGLGQEDVGRFIELVAGITPPQGLVEAVYRQTEGNPLFVTEVVRLLVQEGGLTTGQPQGVAPTVGAVPRGRPDSWTVRIPEGVREVIGRRLNRLSQRCNQTLTIASVIGREFTLEQLKPLIEDMTEDRLLEVLEEALAARVIEELPRSVGRYQFSHALIQETLAGELSLTRKVRLHARIAEALEQLYGPQAEAHAAELAHHFGEAESVLGIEKLVRYSLLAGEKALASYGWEEALAHFARGLTARSVSLTGKEPAAGAQAAALLFGLGRAQAAMGLAHEALASLSRAFDYYAEVGDVARAVAVAECPVSHLPGQLVAEPELLVRALALVPPDSIEAGRLLPLHGGALGLDEGDYQGAQKALTQALGIAQREGDPALELRTLAEAGRVEVYHLRLPECLEKSLRAIALARRLDDPLSEARSRYFASIALWSIGDVKEASLHATAGLASAERLRNRVMLANILWANETISRLTGDFGSAREFSNRGLALMPRDPRLLGTRTLLEYEMGAFDQGDAYYQRLVEAMRQTPSGASFEYAFVASVTGFAAHYTGLVGRFDFDLAKTAAKAVLSSPATTPLVAIRAHTGLALMAVEQGDVAAAEQSYKFHESKRGTMTPGGMGSIDHILGLLAGIMGKVEQAMAHFEDALAFCRKAGYRPEYAHAACDYANMLLQRASAVASEASQPVRPFGRLRAGSEPVEGRGSTSSPRTGGPGSPRTEAQQDRQKAMALLDEALAISRELGMRPLMERVLSRREILTA
jgi:tetratricopeptide (TPR) repeat protein